MWRLFSSIRYRFIHRPFPTIIVIAACFYVLYYVKYLSREQPTAITVVNKPRSPDYDDHGNPIESKKDGPVKLEGVCNALETELGLEAGWNSFVENMNAKQETFQPVGDDKQLYIHSAYSDFRQSGKIRIVGMRQMSAGRALRCQLWYLTDTWQTVNSDVQGDKAAKADVHSDKDAKPTRKVLVRNGGDVQINNIPEGHGTPYVAAFFECASEFEKVRDANGKEQQLQPFAVSLVPPDSECKTPSNFLFVRSTKPVYEEAGPANENGAPRPGPDQSTVTAASLPKRHDFAICVTPLNLAFNRVNQLIEWLELNRILGAAHVVLYNNTLGTDAARVLASYMKEGYVSLVQWQPACRVHIWPVPPGYHEEVHYYAQLGALNDCILRTMSKYKYAVFTDLDEFAVPRAHESWLELRDKYFAQNPSVAYTFRNTFFKLEWADDTDMVKNETLVRYRLNTLLKLKREQTINPPGSRSKLIVDPTMIDTMGIHQVWQFHPRAHVFGGMSHVMPVEIGLLHHYRNWETVGTDGQHDDKFMLKYGDRLVRNVQNVRKKLDALGVYSDKN